MTHHRVLRLDDPVAVRAATLEDVMKRLKEERAKMVRGDRYTLASVYGINNAVDLVAKMMKEDRDE